MPEWNDHGQAGGTAGAGHRRNSGFFRIRGKGLRGNGPGEPARGMQGPACSLLPSAAAAETELQSILTDVGGEDPVLHQLLDLRFGVDVEVTGSGNRLEARA